jgi:hypothetical protein
MLQTLLGRPLRTLPSLENEDSKLILLNLEEINVIVQRHSDNVNRLIAQYGFERIPDGILVPVTSPAPAENLGSETSSSEVQAEISMPKFLEETLPSAVWREVSGVVISHAEEFITLSRSLSGKPLAKALTKFGNWNRNTRDSLANALETYDQRLAADEKLWPQRWYEFRPGRYIVNDLFAHSMLFSVDHTRRFARAMLGRGYAGDSPDNEALGEDLLRIAKELLYRPSTCPSAWRPHPTKWNKRYS